MRSAKECAGLERQWDVLMDECNARFSPRARAFAQLCAAYCEPHRHYHNIQHILDMLDQMPWLALRNDPDKVLVELATWYHDVVYDPRRLDNEDRSAEVARTALTELGLYDHQITRVYALIMMTKTHHAPDDDQNALLFLDGDLSILGMIPEIYCEYSRAIRQEYGWLDVRTYCEGRKNVLMQFLARPRIFHSKYFKTPFPSELVKVGQPSNSEAQARANIAAEIAEIDEILRTLPS